MFPEGNGTKVANGHNIAFCIKQQLLLLRLKEYIFVNRDGLSPTVVQAGNRVRPGEQPKLPMRDVCVLRTLCRVPK